MNDEHQAAIADINKTAETPEPNSETYTGMKPEMLMRWLALVDRQPIVMDAIFHAWEANDSGAGWRNFYRHFRGRVLPGLGVVEPEMKEDAFQAYFAMALHCLGCKISAKTLRPTSENHGGCTLEQFHDWMPEIEIGPNPIVPDAETMDPTLRAWLEAYELLRRKFPAMDGRTYQVIEGKVYELVILNGRPQAVAVENVDDLVKVGLQDLVAALRA